MAVYKIIEKLGEGGMGVVYKALQSPLDREVALKVLQESARGQVAAVARFMREVQASTRVNHPNIIKILDYGELEGQLFYAMEYLPHGTLKDALDKGPLPIRRSVSIARQLLEALSCIHQAGLIHRDLKPANIMMDPEGHLTLMDFGLVKDTERTALTVKGNVVGTPTYLPPEAILGKPLDGRGDLFSSGVVLFELLTGKKPFRGETLQVLLKSIVQDRAPSVKSMRPDCPAWLAAVVEKLLEKSPAHRYPSARACLAAIRQALGEIDGPDSQDLSVDSIMALTDADLELPSEIPQGVVEGGLHALRAADGQPGPTGGRPTGRMRALQDPGSGAGTGPASLRRQTRPIRRLTATTQALQPRTASGPLLPKLAGLAAVVVVAGAALVWWRPREPVAHASSTGASPTETSSGSPSPLAATAGALARELSRALRDLDPERQLSLIYRDHLKIKKIRWFTPVPVPEIVTTRRVWSERLGRTCDRLGLTTKLASFGRVRDSFFGPGGGEPAQRLDLYRRLHGLLSLRYYCDRFKIVLPVDPLDGLSTRYGQMTGPSLPRDGPAVCLNFVLTPEHERSRELPQHAPRPNWKVISVPVSERFFIKGDMRATDLPGALEVAGKEHLEYRRKEPLPLPPLDRIGSLELMGLSSDLHKNNLFTVSLSTDGQTFIDMAIVRSDEYGGRPRPWWHTLERDLLTGQQVYLKVRLTVLPDMIADREYAQLPRLVVAYQERPR
ncbi:MAG: serine/threonine protein kinase [Candidatus Riflebacteria bacterium]|nr:serine/threonine protein kinase [Candidatus Riflebacteria bacterium]